MENTEKKQKSQQSSNCVHSNEHVSKLTCPTIHFFFLLPFCSIHSAFVCSPAVTFNERLCFLILCRIFFHFLQVFALSYLEFERQLIACKLNYVTAISLSVFFFVRFTFSTCRRACDQLNK